MFRIIIDGYNLIFQCGLHAKNLTAPTALQKARSRLVRELADRIDSADRPSLLIVFDAKTEIAFDQSEFVERGFAIRFARDFSDADSMIQELLRVHSDPKRLTVVSSDHQVQTSATRRGAIAVDSDAWFDSLRIKQQKQSNGLGGATQSNDRAAKLSESDQEEILAEFQSIDVSAIEDEIDRPNLANPEGEDAEPVSDDSKEIEKDHFNPFPPGYGEDLIE